MKKMLVAVLVVGVLAATLAGPAEAKKKKKVKPVATTLYMHGPSQFGEIDGALWLADALQGGGEVSPLTMDAVEPDGSEPKSMNFFSPPFNDACTGLPLAYPTFEGALSGTITGDAKITATFVSVPSTVTARLWADQPVFTCNDAYVAPASEVQFQVPAGQGEVEIVFPGLNLTSTTKIMVEILVPDAGSGWSGQAGRLLYDAASAATKIEFNCVPPTGATTCIPEG